MKPLFALQFPNKFPHPQEAKVNRSHQTTGILVTETIPTTPFNLDVDRDTHQKKPAATKVGLSNSNPWKGCSTNSRLH
jgi:hypothetical protein